MADDTFYATTGSNNILKFTAPDTYTVFASGLGNPSGLALDVFGNLYEADSISNRILKFTAPNTYTVYASGLNNPTGLAFDNVGNLYEVNTSSGQILKITAPNTSTVFASGLNFPTSIAVDSSQNVYVSDGGTGQILKYTAPNSSTVYASGLSSPRGVAIDGSGRLYVTEDKSNGTILQFTAANTSTTYASGLSNPFGLAFDKSGNLFATQIDTISRFTAPNTSTTYASGLFYPEAFAFASKTPITIQQVTRTPFASLTSLRQVSDTQLEVFNSNLSPFAGAGFGAGLVDPNKPTLVLTHGLWSSPDAFKNLALSLQAKNPGSNILAWNWSSVAHDLPGVAESRTPDQGVGLGLALAAALGSGYNQPIQFIGHSLGALVDARAAEVFHSHVAGAATQVTLLDEAEVLNLPIAGGSGNTAWNRSIPNTGVAGRIDNYISTVGNIHTEAAANVILQKSPLEDYLNAFHSYPIKWYQETVDSATPAQAGYTYSIINSSPAIPAENSFFYQTERTTFGPDLALTSITKQQADSLITQRNVFFSFSNEGLALTYAKAILLGADLINGAVQIAGHAVLSLEQKIDPNTQLPIAGLTLELQKHSPSYAWLPITIPIGAQTMQFDLQFSNLSAGDWLSAGINDTLLFALESQYVGDGINGASSLLDVSPWAGQNVDLFFGLNNVDDLNVGGTITVHNIQFQVAAPEPSRMVLIAIGMGATLFVRRRPIRKMSAACVAG